MMRLAAFLLLVSTGMLGFWVHATSPCKFPDHLHVEKGVTAEFAIIAGLAVCLFGFRLVHVMTFVCSFLIAGLLTSMAFESTFGLAAWVLVASWTGFIVVGFAGGCIALAFFPLGVGLVGSLLVYAFTASLPYRMLVGESGAMLDAVVALLGGILTWILVRPIVIIASSLVGSTGAVWGIGYFAGKYPSHRDLERFHMRIADDDRTWVYDVPAVWWAYLAAMLVLFIAGIAKQCHDVKKGRNVNHIGLYNGWRSSPNIPLP